MMQTDNRIFHKGSQCHFLPAAVIPKFSLKSLLVLTTHWFQDAAGLSCMCPVLPNNPSACGFDSWFCLSYPLEDQNPALNMRWIAGEPDSLSYFLPAPCTRAGVFSYSAKYAWTTVIAYSQTQVIKPSKTESTCSGLFLVLSRGLIFLASKPAVSDMPQSNAFSTHFRRSL